MFYDKDWIEKQERGFTAWLNFILTPSEFSSSAAETKGECRRGLRTRCYTTTTTIN